MAQHLAKSLFTASILALLLGVGACSDSSDPAGGGNQDTDGTRDLGGGDDAEQDPTADTGGDDVGQDTGADEGADAGDDVGGDDQGGGDSGPFVCGEDPFYLGQVFVDEDPDPLSPDGGVPRFEPYDSSYDAGIQAVVDAMPGDGGSATVDLSITDATVVATSFNTSNTMRANRFFWIADGNASAVVFFLSGEQEERTPPFDVQVGQRLSFDVTLLEVFQGTPQIRNVDQDSWVLESADNEVYIEERVDAPITLADIHKVLRVTGRVSDTFEECPAGGDDRCYVLTYGDSDNTVTLRSSSQFLAGGDCVTYVGPVFQFMGDPRLDTDNFDWLWSYDE